MPQDQRSFADVGCSCDRICVATFESTFDTTFSDSQVGIEKGFNPSIGMSFGIAGIIDYFVRNWQTLPWQHRQRLVIINVNAYSTGRLSLRQLRSCWDVK